MSDLWTFRSIASIEEAIFNNTLERFYKYGIDGLVRENIQNSLDGVLKEEGKPAPTVEVIIRTGTMSPDQVPGIEDVKKHIAALNGQNKYTKETIAHMRACVDKQEVPYISFEDRNTKGLSGAEHGEDIQEGDTWGVYAYKKGVHFTESDQDFEKSRGGSHGIGKIASNAASDLHMMYFSNCDQNGNQHIGGTVQLIEHTIDGKNYRSTGYFTKVDSANHFYPFENRFDEVFRKDTRGLKIVIPYLRKQFADEETKGIIRAVCDNFFIAILNKKLVVNVDGQEINDISLDRYIHDQRIYPEQNYDEIKTNFTPLYVETYTQYDFGPVTVSDLRTKYNFHLYFHFDENSEIKKGRVAIVRGIGMKIEDFKVKSYVNAPYNAVLIPASNVEDDFLKSLENEAHTELSYDHIKDPSEQANAKRFINNLTREMQSVVITFIRNSTKSDGKIDTSDLIYTMEVNFRTEMAKNVTTVQLTKGTASSPKEIVKVKTTKKNNTKQKEKKKKESKLKKLVRKAMKKDNQGNEVNRVRYNMEPEAVKRIVIKGKEKLAFDFREVAAYSGETKCDISLAVIDGMGASKENEFDISTSYSQIKDLNRGQNCAVKGNIIKDVSIQDGRVNMEMNTTDQFNEALKFMYYVEV